MAKILDTKSSHPADAASASSPSLISAQKLIAIYGTMLRCRMLEQRAAALFQQGKLDSDLHASSGREACAVAVGVDLEPEDTVCVVSGDWLPSFVKSLPAEILFHALAPGIDGHFDPASVEARRPDILASPSGAGQASMVRDRAEELHSAKKAAIVAAFLHPARDEAGHWREVLSAAAAKKLPVVFVQYVTGDRLPAPVSERSRSKTPQALLHGVPSIAVDAADVVALYRVAYEAITRARQGRGATILECAAVPILTSTDPATNQPLQPPDPVVIMESYMKSMGIQPENYNRQVVSQFTRELDHASRFLAS